MMYYAGLDIHKAFTVGVIKTKEGELVHKDKFENTQEEIDEFFKDFPADETEVVMESTCVWEHIYNKISSRGYKVKLANPVKTRAIAETRIKTDSIDANTLADLLRANLVAESYIPNKEIRRLRDVVRQRKSIVKGSTQIKNKVQSILIKHGIKIPFSKLCPKAIRWLKENNEVNEVIDIKHILVSYFNLLDQYKNELKFIDEHIKKTADEDKQANLLMTIPGIAEIRALEIISEIADIARFSSAKHLCSYAGLIPSIRQSGTSLKFGRLVQQSSKSLKNALIEASWSATKCKEANSLKLHYLRLVKKKGKQKAICATARKMLCVIYAMLTKSEEFKA